MRVKKLIICVSCGEEKRHAAHNLCTTCYNKQHKQGTVVCATCGGEKQHRAHGLCSACYNKQHVRPTSVCESCKQEKPKWAKNLCKECYNKQHKKPLCICKLCKKEAPHCSTGLYNTCYKRLTRYNLTYDAFMALVRAQNNKCAICGEEFKPGKICVDHDHGTNVVRELLCSNCNSALGYSRENIGTLNNIIKYIKKHQAK